MYLNSATVPPARMMAHLKLGVEILEVVFQFLVFPHKSLVRAPERDFYLRAVERTEAPMGDRKSSVQWMDVRNRTWRHVETHANILMSGCHKPRVSSRGWRGFCRDRVLFMKGIFCVLLYCCSPARLPAPVHGNPHFFVQTVFVFYALFASCCEYRFVGQLIERRQCRKTLR